MKKNMGLSVQARLKNLSAATKLDMPTLLRRYVQERLLYRLSVSTEAHNFVLKGGLLMAAYNEGALLRPTEDIDFSGLSEEGSVDLLRRALLIVFETPVDEDGVEFNVPSMKIAKDRTGIVPGGKIDMMAKVGTANVNLKIDVGFGNPVTPDIRYIEFPTLLDGITPRPSMNAYPLETVIAEKLHAMVQFGQLSTRLKDHYDIWMMSKLHAFEGDLIADAIENTFRFQEREIPEILAGLSDEYVQENLVKWKGFLSKLQDKPTFAFPEVVEDLRVFLLPPLAEARDGVRSGYLWEPSIGWQGLEMSFRP